MKTRPGFAIVLLIAVATLVAGNDRAGGAEKAEIANAPERLSQTGLYADIASRVVAARNLPFEPQYPLWTDGAQKSRWIQLPEGAAIDATDVTRWQFPVGTKLWKEFSFDGHNVETRMLWRATATQWVFASYVWNDEQSDAFLAPASGIRNHYKLPGGAQYSIPAEIECRACHESGGTPALGFNALQLSDDRDPLALHAKPLASPQVTNATLDRMRLLSPRRPELAARPPRIDARTPRERAVLGYFTSNCGSCHNERSPIAALGLFLQHRDAHAGQQPAITTSVNVPGEYQTPGAAEGMSRRVAPGLPEVSAIAYRMSSRRASSQMPPLGTAVVDREAVEMVRAWIREDLAR